MSEVEGEVEFLERKLSEVQQDLELVRAVAGGVKGGGTTALTQLHRLELEVMAELRAARVAQLDRQAPAGDEGELHRLLRDVRSLRQRAEAKGSMVAAGRLLEREQSILAELAEQDRQAEERARLAADQEGLEARLAGALDRLPEEMARRLVQRLSARLVE